MEKYKVVEKFVSINGEGTKAGQLSVFIRLQECNLNCSYCDTKWANMTDSPFEYMTCEEIYSYIKETNVVNVTLTGGEPLLYLNVKELLNFLSNDKLLSIEIETNGSIELEPFCNISNNISFTMDYKLQSSNMESKNKLSNFFLLKPNDTVKFVVSNIEDLERAKSIINSCNLVSKCSIYLSPVYGKIELPTIVEFMIKNNMNYVNMQLQIHKFIWDPNQQGV